MSKYSKVKAKLKTKLKSVNAKKNLPFTTGYRIIIYQNHSINYYSNSWKLSEILDEDKKIKCLRIVVQCIYVIFLISHYDITRYYDFYGKAIL